MEMAAKRLFSELGSDPDQQLEKRTRSRPTLASYATRPYSHTHRYTYKLYVQRMISAINFNGFGLIADKDDGVLGSRYPHGVQ